MVWAEEPAEFPSGFGADGLLFTADDPLAPLASGWTVVDLDQAPFARLRDARVETPIDNGDVSKDLTQGTYTEAFDALTRELEQRYPYTDLKGLDWNAIVGEVRPRVVSAEQAGDAVAFDEALMRLSVLMGDGHAAVLPPSFAGVIESYGGGVGLRLGRVDDGTVFVIDVQADSPAARAGIELGARIERWGGLPVEQALAAIDLSFSASTEHGALGQRLAFLARARVGAAVAVEYANPGAEPVQLELEAQDDLQGLDAALSGDFDPGALPVSLSVLPSGIGYIRVTTFQDDVTLLTHAWEFALERVQQLGLPALVIDVRGNGGGVSQVGTYMAGSFFSEPFLRSRRFAKNDAGELVHNADDVIWPAPLQWTRPVAVLVDAGCVSVCEEFASAMASLPEPLVVGSSRTAGTAADVRFWDLPAGLQFYAPLGLFQTPDGEVLVEGTGVTPTLHVPLTLEGLLSPDDEVLQAAEDALSSRLIQE